jgi:hypothetical protein
LALFEKKIGFASQTQVSIFRLLATFLFARVLRLGPAAAAAAAAAAAHRSFLPPSPSRRKQIRKSKRKSTEV